MRNYEKPTYQVCPYCGSGEIHNTQWRGFVERCAMYLWSLSPYRCRSCCSRFYLRPLPQRGTATKAVGLG